MRLLHGYYCSCSSKCFYFLASYRALKNDLCHIQHFSSQFIQIHMEKKVKQKSGMSKQENTLLLQGPWKLHSKCKGHHGFRSLIQNSRGRAWCTRIRGVSCCGWYLDAQFWCNSRATGSPLSNVNDISEEAVGSCPQNQADLGIL